ncbi:hypothetical protein WMF31_21590 [Sorangium sp. So ce1036]|uniref:hypothetical protein n=1 Tax=Sorangium sp. So ce1036 TaxID=3133328 RepID=UPI003F0315A4
MEPVPPPLSFTSLATLAALVLTGASPAGCAPEPRSVPCSNDGECRRVDDDLRYCLSSRCVACLSSAMCGDGSQCVDGRCVSGGCQDTRDCGSGQICREGTCEAG